MLRQAGSALLGLIIATFIPEAEPAARDWDRMPASAVDASDTTPAFAGGASAEGTTWPADPGVAARLAQRAAEEGASSAQPVSSTAPNGLRAHADALLDAGRSAEAAAAYRELASGLEARLGEDHPETLQARSDLGFALTRSGQAGEAAEVLAAVAEKRRSVLGEDHPDIFHTLHNLGAALEHAGRYEEAERIFRDLVPASRAELGPHHLQTLEATSSLASVLKEQGRLGETERYYREVLEIRSAILPKEHPDRLRSLNNLASTLSAQGRHQEAAPLYRAAFDGRRKALGADAPATLISQNNLATSLLAMQRTEEAADVLEDALERSRRVLGPQHPQTLKTEANLAHVLGLLGQGAASGELNRSVLRDKREVLGADHPSTLVSLANAGSRLIAQARYAEAAEVYREVLDAGERRLGGTHPLILRVRENLAIAHILSSRLDDAADALREAGEGLLKWADAELDTTRQAKVRRLLLHRQAAFQNLAIGLAALEPTATTVGLAADVMLQWKGLAGERDAVLARLSARSQDHAVRTYARMVSIRRSGLAAAVARGDPEAPRLLERLEKAEARLSRLSREYREASEDLSITWQDVRGALRPGEVLLEFRQYQPYLREAGPVGGFGPARIAAVLLSPKAPPRFTDLGEVGEARALMRKIVNRPRPSDEPPERLARMLLGPFEAELSAARRVYLAPDSVLSQVPFGRLPFAGASYWLMEQDIRIVQSGRALLRPRGEPDTAGLLAVGGVDFDGADEQSLEVAELTATSRNTTPNFRAAGARVRSALSRFRPLGETGAEVRAIASLYSAARSDEPVEIWVGGSAREGRIKGIATPPRTLHLATHGFYLPRNEGVDRPMLLSGLSLAGANPGLKGETDPDGEDGVLYAIEAMGLNLQGTELVVLSACDTALGSLDYSEGVYGLARAFRIAGAANVLMTLWPIDDRLAREFMEDFYANLFGGYDDPAAALRQTQIEWIRSDDPMRANPFVWAPYVLTQKGL